MKILIIHNYYQQSGGERVAVEAQEKLLEKHGHKIILYTRDSSEIDSYNFAEKVVFLPETIFSHRTYTEIKTLAEKERPDIAHVHNVFPLISPVVYRVLKNVGVPIVQTLHNFRFLCPSGLFFVSGQNCERCKYGNTLHAIPRKCYRQSYSFSTLYAMSIGIHRRMETFQMIDRFIALTGFTAKKLLETKFTTADKISVLGNFLPIPRFSIVKDRLPYIVYLGRLSPEKGITTLIKAMDGTSGLTLKIAGSGPQLQELQNIAQKRNLSTQVQFLGRINGDEKWELLRNAMAIVIPSVCYENLPFTILESMAVGTPVIASDNGSLPYVVEHGKSGVLFTSGDSVDLREKIQELKNNPIKALEMGDYARRIVEERYTEDVHYKQLMQIYREVVH